MNIDNPEIQQQTQKNIVDTVKIVQRRRDKDPDLATLLDEAMAYLKEREYDGEYKYRHVDGKDYPLSICETCGFGDPKQQDARVFLGCHMVGHDTTCELGGLLARYSIYKILEIR